MHYHHKSIGICVYWLRELVMIFHDAGRLAIGRKQRKWGYASADMIVFHTLYWSWQVFQVFQLLLYQVTNAYGVNYI